MRRRRGWRIVPSRGLRAGLAPYRVLARRPLLLAAAGVHELALLGSRRAPKNLKVLAELRASTLVGCPW
jgi:hypothetical protein